MNKIYKIPGLLLMALLFSSCSHDVVGTWTIEKYETLSPGGKNTALTNIGTLTFFENGNGEKNLNYNVLGSAKRDTTPFHWVVTENYITLEGQESEIEKTWIIINSSSKVQSWNATDGKNQVQILNLKKNKAE